MTDLRLFCETTGPSLHELNERYGFWRINLLKQSHQSLIDPHYLLLICDTVLLIRVNVLHVHNPFLHLLLMLILFSFRVSVSMNPHINVVRIYLLTVAQIVQRYEGFDIQMGLTVGAALRAPATQNSGSVD